MITTYGHAKENGWRVSPAKLLSLEIIDWFAMLKLTWILFLHHFLVRRTAEWLGRKKGTKREGEEEQGMTKRSMLAICQRKPSSGNWRCFNCTENDKFPPSEGDGKGWVRRDQPRASSGCAVSSYRELCWVWRHSPCLLRVAKGKCPLENSETSKA